MTGYLTSAQVSERVQEEQPVTVEEVAAHYDGTLFWNRVDTLDRGLADPRRDEEYPLRVQSTKPDEDGFRRHGLWYENGESTINVGDIFENTHSDETASEIDAEFIANLPVYIPALFREIYRLRKEAERYRAIREGVGDVYAAVEEKQAWGGGDTATVRLTGEELDKAADAAIAAVGGVPEPVIEVKHEITLETLDAKLQGLRESIVDMALKVARDAVGTRVSAKLGAELPRSTGVEMIAIERERQIETEGFIHDKEYKDGELPRAATSYLVFATAQVRGKHPPLEARPPGWPWKPEWWKADEESSIPNLIKAGALIAAEIDRQAATRLPPAGE